MPSVFTARSKSIIGSCVLIIISGTHGHLRGTQPALIWIVLTSLHKIRSQSPSFYSEQRLFTPPPPSVLQTSEIYTNSTTHPLGPSPFYILAKPKYTFHANPTTLPNATLLFAGTTENANKLTNGHTFAPAFISGQNSARTYCPSSSPSLPPRYPMAARNMSVFTGPPNIWSVTNL